MQSFVEINQWTDFCVTQRIFSLIGVDLKDSEGNSIIRRPFLGLFFFLAYLGFVVICIDFVLKNLDNLVDTTTVLSLLSQLIIALWKTIIFVYKRKGIWELVHRISCWNKEEGVHIDELDVLAKFRNGNLRICTFYYACVVFSGFTGVLRPILMKIVQNLQGNEYPLELPHKGSFFWDTTTPTGYMAAFVWNNLMLFFLIHIFTGVDTLFLWFTFNIVKRYRILNLRFRRMAAANDDLALRLSLIDNIRLHCDMLNKIEEVNATFGEIIFVQSLISCLQICFLLYRFTSGGEQQSMSVLVYQATFLLAVVVQLMLYCYSGQKIKDESLMVSTEIYRAFEWSVVPSHIQRMLLMIMFRCQRSVNIMGIFFNLDLALYLWFFKTAGSLIAVLKTMESDA